MLLRLLVVLLLFNVAVADETVTYELFMIWDHHCLEHNNVRVGKQTYLIAPFGKDGHVDLKQSKLIHAVIDVEESCGHLEARKISEVRK